MGAALDRDKSDKSYPLLQTQYCNENKTHQHWSDQFSSVCLYCRSFQFYNQVLYVENQTWPYFQSYGFVLSRCDSTGFWIDIPTSIKSGGHGLARRVGVYLAGINSNIRFEYDFRLSDKSFINNCFACKNDKWATNDVFSNFFPIDLYLPLWRDKICIGGFVWANVSQVW